MSIEAAFIVPHPPLIIPAVGRGEEAGIQKTIDAYDEVARRIADIAPELVIVTSPHATAYRDWFHVSPGKSAKGDLRQFRAPHSTMKVSYDAEFTKHLSELAAERDFPAGTAYERDPELDHATYVPLWFLNKFYRDYKTVRIGLSGLDGLAHYQLGELIAQCVEELGRKAVFVASGDLSHKLTEDGPYGFAPEGPEFDEQVTRAMASGDFGRFLDFDDDFYAKAAGCGLASFQIMAGALDGKAVEPELLSYEGPFGVGYAVASFRVTGSDERRRFGEAYRMQQKEHVAEHLAGEDPYVALARADIESFVKTGRPLERPDGLPAEMLERRAGVFVSIHENGRLRGCIGTIEPTAGCIADEIIRNGVSACSEDPRFAPVREDELASLEINVDVLGATEQVSGSEELDPVRYGVVVTNGARRGLLLPNLDGVDTVEDQVRIARQKAGIGEREDCALERFEVVRHE